MRAGRAARTVSSTISVPRAVSDDRYRCSFDSVADRYERARPAYADEAVAWIAERLPFERVLDLAAGTGKLTRQLVAAGAEVIAVEPGDAMRAVLEQVVSEAQALAGSAEAIPVPDGSVDAVTVGQAFHWFRTGEALAELHRVLRPGGGFALLWNEWDDDDPLLHELNVLIEELRPTSRSNEIAQRETVLAESPLFGELDERSFAHADRLRADARVRALVGEREVDFPLITTVIVTDRV